MHNPARVRVSGSLATLSLRVAMGLCAVLSSVGAIGCQAQAAAQGSATSVQPAPVPMAPPRPIAVTSMVPQPLVSPPLQAPAKPPEVQLATPPPVPAPPTVSPTLMLATPLIATGGRWLAPANYNPVIMTETAGPLVRVRLTASAHTVHLFSDRSPTMTLPGWPQARALGVAGKSVLIRRVTGGWEVGGVKLESSASSAASTAPSNSLPGVLVFSPAPPVGGTYSPLEIEGTAYRGQIRLVPLAGGDNLQFDVINDVGLEDYLLSVVSNELLSGFHPEAFATQAVVARTYALFEVRTVGTTRHWDVWADTRSQVYGGISSETPRATAAVKSTRGVVIAYGPAGAERIFKTYFAACCGGIGQSAADAFGEPPLPPLEAKNAGSLCRASPSYRWSSFTVVKADLANRIRAWATRRNRPDLQIDSLRALEVTEKNRFGRPVKFQITDAHGNHPTINGEELRWAVNFGRNASDKDLWSSLMLPVDTGDAIRFSQGAGMGHGVGLCQWCAQAMALRGDHHEAIIAWSYPGSVLKKAYQ